MQKNYIEQSLNCNGLSRTGTARRSEVGGEVGIGEVTQRRVNGKYWEDLRYEGK